MDLRKSSAVAIAFALALVLTAPAARAEKTLWLVRPLYPGQEALVERAEQALDKLTPQGARADAIIGPKELAAALQGRVVAELPCFSAEQRCADPTDAFVAGLGFERIVLIQGGQDEVGFKFRVASYEPKSGKSAPATAVNANLEKALLGAVAKVVPVASTLQVTSAPAGATVFVDDVKVGVTPLTTQVLPGERVIRLDLKLHQPLEETLVIPIRGAASLDKALEKVAARIVISALPAGTEISIDGQPIGRDKVDRGIAPGDHTIRLTAEGHKAFEQTISMRADQQFSLDKTLEPIAKPDDGAREKPAVIVVQQGNPEARPGEGGNAQPPQQPPPPPPRPLTAAEQVYERHQYIAGTWEVGFLTGSDLVGRRFQDGGLARTTRLTSPARMLTGGSLEYGTFGKYFGVTVFGLSYLTNTSDWSSEVGYTSQAGGCEFVKSASVCKPSTIDGVKVHFLTARALHLQLRLAAWRFQLGLQLGPDFRVGWILGGPQMGDAAYVNGFIAFDFFVSARANVRLYLVEGLFLALQGNFAFHVIGEEATDDTGQTFRNSHQYGFNGGLGYAF